MSIKVKRKKKRFKQNLSANNKTLDKFQKHINHIKKSRGYNHEYDLVNRFRRFEIFKNDEGSNWDSLRLGGPGQADVISVNHDKSIIVVMECKSSSRSIIEIPSHQIKRGFTFGDFFRLYRHKFAIFAFKYGVKTRNLKTKIYERRELREYYLVIDTEEFSNGFEHIDRIFCSYELGPKITIPKNNEWILPHNIYESFPKMVKFLEKCSLQKDEEEQRIQKEITTIKSKNKTKENNV